MRQFKDKTGQDWTIDLTYGAVLRVKSLTSFDLLRPDREVPLEDFGEDVTLHAKLMLDFPSLWEVLYAICSPQCESRGISAEQFGELMAADCLVAAREVFREEWRDFFQGLQRPDQAMVLEKIGNWLAAGNKKLAAAMTNPMLSEIDPKILSAMDSTLKNSFGVLEERLAAIPEASPGVNST